MGVLVHCACCLSAADFSSFDCHVFETNILLFIPFVLSRPIARLDTALELSAVPNTADLADSVDTFLPFSMVTLLRALSLSVQCTCGHGGSDGSKDEGPLELAHANNSDLGLAGDSEVSLLDDGGVKFNDLVDAQVLQHNRTSYIRTHISKKTNSRSHR